MAVSLDRGTNLGGQTLLGIRFEENQLNSGNCCLCPDIVIRRPRDQNNRNRHVPVPQAVCDRYSVHVGQDEIQHEAVESFGIYRVQHGRAAFEGPDVEVLRFEKKPKRTEDIQVVIDHADFGFLGQRFLERRWHLKGPQYG